MVGRLCHYRRLVNAMLAESHIRKNTGCNVVAVVQGTYCDVNPDVQTPLSAGAELVLIGDIESEARFFEQYGL